MMGQFAKENMDKLKISEKIWWESKGKKDAEIDNLN
jgi:hypothetical protein